MRSFFRRGATLLIHSALGLASLFISNQAHAYPSFIGYGYSSCLVCHYNPIGGGPLTDYGRALGANTISAKPPFALDKSDDQLTSESGFLGSAKLPSWLRPAAAFRELWMRSDLQNDPKTTWITMQGESSLTIPLLEGKLIFSGTAGYIPPPAPQGTGADNTNTSTFISREHYVAYHFTDSVSAYAGFLDPSFGIHSPDHESFFRAETLLDQADQVHSLLINIETEKMQIVLQPFAGNLYQDASVRQRGFTMMNEFEVAENTRVGFSALASSSDYRKHEMGEVHTRIGVGEGNSILAEIGVQRNAFPKLGTQQNSEFLWIQTSTLLTRGLSLLSTVESYVPDMTMPTSRLWNAGPSLDYFPFQRLEFRMDFLASETLGQQNYNPDIYTLLFQTHIWL